MIKDNTKTYQNMIESFECDFSLAIEDIDNLTELQEKLDSQDKKLMKDIELLQRLSYGLRNGKIMIIEEDE